MMDIDTKKLVQTEFLAFAMKAHATLKKGRRLGNDKYLKLLAQSLTRVATGETKRLVIAMPPRHGKTFMGFDLLVGMDFGARCLSQNPCTLLWPGPCRQYRVRHTRHSAYRMVSAGFQHPHKQKPSEAR